VVRSLTSLVALAALAPAPAAPASAQPIDLLGSPTVTAAPPKDTAPSDTRAATALPLVGPPLPADEPRRAFLDAARRALEAGRIEEAREALERAETRLLNAPTAPVQASSPERQVLAIGEARRALAAHDRQGAIRAIDDALAAATLGARVTTPSPPPVAPTQPAPDQPSVTYALLPGHWQLQGAQYVWVPPEIDPRPVAYWRFVQGRYVWRGGEWVWAPAHYE
jgi:WXXGXW repeat (2 copies)